MINKIGATPSFTSKINVVYNKDFSLRDFYSSRIMDDQMNDLKFNGEKDSVTLIPVPAHYQNPPMMKVQVMKRLGHKIAYETETIKEPEELLSAYHNALNKINKSEDKNYVHNNAIIMDYMV